jgi:ABC-2 type transport system permease protein
MPRAELRNVGLVFRRELAAYFATPLAYIFIVIFLVMAGTLTFFVGGFLSRDQADLQTFFAFHPWLYLFLVPALSMRLWAEERRLGTVELFLTLPISMTTAVVGKFLAAWAFTAIALALTFPMWITVAFLGNPDHGVIVASYIGSLLMAGSYLAVGAMISATTKNQVIAFVVTAAVALVLTLAGSPAVLTFLTGWAPAELIESVANFGFVTHFQAIQRGVIDVRDMVFFASIIVVSLAANTIIVDWKKAE